MKYHCNKDKPAGYDPQKHKFLKHWCYNFLDRKGLSIRRKTNKKKVSIFEKLHKIKNYHHFTVFELADADISSASSSEESASEESSSQESSVESESEEENSEFITSEEESELVSSDEDSS